MRLWFTSDHHFEHKNAIEYGNRPFKDVDEMNDVLIARWNEVVAPDDIVYHLGDFTLGDVRTAAYFFAQLNGFIHVLGNPWHHDKRWLDCGRTIYMSKSDKGVIIEPPMVVLDKEYYCPVPIVLCHYPLATWDRKYYGSIHLHGHSHGNYKYPAGNRAMDVGVDCLDFYPVSLGEIISGLMTIDVDLTPPELPAK